MFWIIAASLVACAYGDLPTIHTCTIGEKWVDNFIVKECYKDPSISKGIRAIGCSPTNNVASKDIIQDGNTYKDKNFVYKCSKSGSTMTYQPIKCIAGDGKIFETGTDHTDDKGTVWTCKQTKSGARLSFKEESGCTLEGKTIKLNGIVTIPLKKMASDNPLTGIQYKCIYEGGKYVMKVRDCKMEKTSIQLNRFGEYKGQVYKCFAKGNDVILELIKNGTCTFKGKSYGLNSYWDDEESLQRYSCQYKKDSAQIIIWGCLFYIPKGNSKESKLYRISRNSAAKINKKYYHCVKGAGKVEFFHIVTLTGKMTQCGNVDGAERSLYDIWAVNSTEYTCAWGPKVRIFRCIYPENPSIKLNNNKYVKINETHGIGCKFEDNVAYVFYISGAEYNAKFGSKKGNSGSIDGSGGSGGGGKLGTTTPVFSTQPTKNTEPVVTSKMTTAKEPSETSTSVKVTKPTTIIISTTEKPTEPSITTKKQTKPSSTTQKATDSTTIEIIHSSSMPTKASPSTVKPNKKCKDLDRSCKELKSMCAMSNEKIDNKDAHEIAHRALKSYGSQAMDEYDYLDEYDETDCDRHYSRCIDSGSYESDDCQRHHMRCCACNRCAHRNDHTKCRSRNHSHDSSSCNELRESATKFITKLCPKTCNQCDKKHKEGELNAAAERLALLFRRY